MLEGKLLTAFSSVAKLQSFDLAAQHLHITQSAVSQRIKQLELKVGQNLLVRSNPIKLTPAGFTLLQHVQKLELLENQLERELNLSNKTGPIRLTLGINADSLFTWFWQAIEPLLLDQNYLFELITADQEQTLDLMKQGRAQAIISAHNKPVTGAKSEFLGNMPYQLVATQRFSDKYFKNGVTKKSLKHAPTAVYGKDDELTFDYLKQFYGLETHYVPYHTLPSSEAFEKLVLADGGYTLLPELQTAKYIHSGQLINLAPNNCFSVPLHLHSWQLNNQTLQDVLVKIKLMASNLLE